MEKLVYLLRDAAERPGEELRSALLERAVPDLRGAGALRITTNVNDEHVAHGKAVTIRRSDPPLRAALGFWMHDSDDRAACEAALRPHAAALAGYLVVESRPLVHVSPTGRRSRGVNMITCIHRRADLPEEEFTRIWHEDHKRVAIAIQSTFGYVRNTVVRTLTGDAPGWDGIVEESFPLLALTDPLVWYDCDTPEEHHQRVQQMLESCARFLDLERLESTPMSEYYLG